MKKLITLLVLIMGLVGQTKVDAATSTTIYYAVPALTVNNGSYTVEINIKYGGQETEWIKQTMTKTEKTYFSNYIYSVTVTLPYGGYYNMEFLVNGNCENNVYAGDWNTDSKNEQMYDRNVGWKKYNYDKTVTVHYKNTTSWTNVYCHCFFNDGANDVNEHDWGESASLATVNSLNGDWYDYKITNWPCTNIIFNNGINPGTENTDKTPSITIGDESDYWVTDGPTSTTATSTPPSDCKYTRSVSAGNFGTICLPYASTVTGATVFKITGKIVDGSSNLKGINLTSVESLEAGKSYIFKATSETLTASYFGSKADASESDAMLGNLYSTPITVENGNYIISGNELRKVNGGTAKVGQYKAYITNGIESLPSASRSEYYIGFNNETEGIDEIESTRNVDNETFYNLAGQRVVQPTKGLYIVNGKKMLRK